MINPDHQFLHHPGLDFPQKLNRPTLYCCAKNRRLHVALNAFYAVETFAFLDGSVKNE